MERKDTYSNVSGKLDVVGSIPTFQFLKIAQLGERLLL